MLSTRVIVFMIISVFIGGLHFGISKLIKAKDAKTDGDKLQVMLFHAWGRRGLIFSLFMLPVYFLRDDIFLLVVLIYLGLLGYNSFLLRQGIAKMKQLYGTKLPTSNNPDKRKDSEF